MPLWNSCRGRRTRRSTLPSWPWNFRTTSIPISNVEAYLGEIGGMAHEVKRYLTGGLATRVTGLCRYLFHEMGFRGNKEGYYDPRNSYLNEVLNRKTGIPISLTALVMAIGSRAGLRVVGIGLPGHFVARANDGENDVLFDPFHGGRILGPQACETLVQQVTGKPFRATAEALAPLPLDLMVHRMLANLKAIYLRAQDPNRAVQVIGRLRQLHPDDPVQVRDLGIALVQAGEPGTRDRPPGRLPGVNARGTGCRVRSAIAGAGTGDVAKWN